MGYLLRVRRGVERGTPGHPAAKGESVVPSRKNKEMPGKKTGGSSGGSGSGGGDENPPGGNIGDALRRVYHDAVDEAVPDDLLDLLKKLS